MHTHSMPQTSIYILGHTMYTCTQLYIKSRKEGENDTHGVETIAQCVKAVPTKQGGPIWIPVTIPKAGKVMYTSVILALHRLGRQASSLGDQSSSSFSNRLHLMGIRRKHLPLVNL